MENFLENTSFSNNYVLPYMPVFKLDTWEILFFCLVWESKEVENHWVMRRPFNSHVRVGLSCGVCTRSSWDPSKNRTFSQCLRGNHERPLPAIADRRRRFEEIEQKSVVFS